MGILLKVQLKDKGETMYKEIDFNKDIDFNLTNSGYTYFKKEKLVLLNFYSYNGPITMQYLPNGGIQSTYNYHLIIKVNNGFLACDNLIYKNKKISSREFIENNKDLINFILPS